MNHPPEADDPTGRVSTRGRRAALLSSGLVPPTLGAAALLGWWTGWMQGARVMPEWAPMMPWTAVGMIAGGAAILTLGWNRAGGWRRALASLLAVIPGVVGVAAMLATRSHRALALGSLLFPAALDPLALPGNGVPAPNTGAAFLVFSVAVLVRAMSPGGFLWASRTAAGLVAGTGFLALVGYTYGLADLYGIAAYTPMSLTTAVGVLFLAFGVLALDPRGWLLDLLDARHGGGLLARRLVPAVIVVPVVVGLLPLWAARHGWVDLAFAVSLLVVATVLTLLVVTWWSARLVHRIEIARAESMRAVTDSEARFRSLAENAAEAIVTIDEHDRIVFANPGFERILGYKPEDLIGHPFSGLVPERFRSAHLAGIARYLHTRDRNIPWDGIELPGLAADGREVPLEITFSDYTRGDTHFFTGIMRDVTSRHSAAERQDFLLDASRALSGSLDTDTVLGTIAHQAVPLVADWCAFDVLEVDGTLRRVACAHADPRLRDHPALIGGPFTPGDTDPGHGGLPEVVKTGQIEIHEDLQGEGPNEGLTSSLVMPLRGEGTVLGAISLVQAASGRRFDEDDVALVTQLAALVGIALRNARLHRGTEEARTEAEARAREEEALRRAAAALSATFSTAEVVEQIARGALVATDADGALVERIDADTGQAQVMAAAGSTLPQVSSRLPFSDASTRRVVDRLEPEVIDRVGDSTYPFSADLVRTCPDCRALVVPLVDAGETLGALILLRRADRDVFRQDEMERAFTFGDLAGLAFRKVRVLEESERRREELERVSESRARLMRGFSHDLKNPLGAADGYAELLMEGVLGNVTEKQSVTLGRLRRSLGSALSLIEDLLELARTEAGQIEIRPAPTDVREAVLELAEGYRVRASAKGLDFEVELPDQLPVVQSDPNRVRQVLGNLISNAVKYTETGSIRIRAQDQGDHVVVEVEDTGGGIPEDRRPFLFQEFSRLEPDREEGAGLGLAIARQIARALGGEIRLESQVGVGSTFSLWLPRTSVEASAEGAREGY